MFDLVKSSYDLGSRFTNIVCQTKDIEDCVGGTMTDYWISPDGYLWYPDYRDTHTFEVIDENDPRYNDKLKWTNFQWISTGQKGKYRVHPITKYVEIYPQTWDGHWRDWPTCRIHFKYGKVVEYQDITGCRQ